jgi:hypothetical protein
MRLPATKLGLVIRTDFSDKAAWEAVRARLDAGHSQEHNAIAVDEQQLLYVDDSAYAGLAPEQASSLVEEANDVWHEAIFLADGTTMSTADQTLLAVTSPDDHDPDLPWTFRLKPESVVRINMMLSSGRLSFWEYLEDVDDNGVYMY